MTVQRCPCCQQPLRQTERPKPARICYDCGRPILRSHRFTYQERAGNTAVVHRVCSNPNAYYRAAECKKRGVVYYKEMSDEVIARMTRKEDQLEVIFDQYRRDNGKA